LRGREQSKRVTNRNIEDQAKTKDVTIRREKLKQRVNEMGGT
jgi:hypothetical protein